MSTLMNLKSYGRYPNLPKMPYITNGLIAMWEGICNKGIDQVHDNNTLTWVSLLGNYNMNILKLSNGGYWEDDGFRYNHITRPSSNNTDECYFNLGNTDIQSQLGNTFTIGFTGIIYPGNARNYTGFIGDSADGGINGFFIERKSSTNKITCGVRGSSDSGSIDLTGIDLSSQSPIPVSISYVCNSGNSKVYVNGVLNGTVSNTQVLGNQGFCIGVSYTYRNEGYNSANSVFFRTPLAKFNRVWIYNRALTEDEVVSQYNIDVSRYNLT